MHGTVTAQLADDGDGITITRATAGRVWSRLAVDFSEARALVDELQALVVQHDMPRRLEPSTT